MKTENQLETLRTIETTKKTCMVLNEKLNQQSKNLDMIYDYEKSVLRTIRDKNIETIQLINELELKGVL